MSLKTRLTAYVTVGALGLASLAPTVYSQEKFRAYADGDSVVILHKDTAETEGFYGKPIKDILKEVGGADSIVRIPTTEIDTLYVKDGPKQLSKPNSLESKTANTKHWYNSKWFQILAPTIVLTGAYLIYDNNNKDKNKKDPTDEIINDIHGGRTGESDIGGVRVEGGRNDNPEAGGNR